MNKCVCVCVWGFLFHCSFFMHVNCNVQTFYETHIHTQTHWCVGVRRASTYICRFVLSLLDKNIIVLVTDLYILFFSLFLVRLLTLSLFIFNYTETHGDRRGHFFSSGFLRHTRDIAVSLWVCVCCVSMMNDDACACVSALKCITLYTKFYCIYSMLNYGIQMQVEFEIK